MCIQIYFTVNVNRHAQKLVLLLVSMNFNAANQLIGTMKVTGEQFKLNELPLKIFKTLHTK